MSTPDGKLPGSEFLAQLYESSWFGPEDEKQIFIRYYTPVLLSPEKFTTQPSTQRYQLLGRPFRVAIAEIADQEYMSHHPWFTSSPTGDSRLLVERLQRKLPTSLYTLLSTPLAPGDRGWITATRDMDSFASLLRSSLGSNFVFKVAREAIVAIPSGDMAAPTPIIPMPQPPDGPFLERANFDSLREILEALPRAPTDVAARAVFALELLERAAQEASASKFFYYWVAVEVLCATYKTKKIITQLTKAYNASRSHVQNTLGFDAIYDMRTDLIHYGRAHDMPQDVERYVRALFMDLLRLHLGLPCAREMERHIASGFSVDRLKREVGRTKVLSIDARQRPAKPEQKGPDDTPENAG